MKKENSVKILLTIFIILISFGVNAKDSQEGEHGGKVNTKDGVSEYIDHHLLDSHYFNFFSDGETGAHYGFPLPVILWDNGVKVFSASEFHHGEDLAVIDGQHYKLHESKIYKTNSDGTLNYSNDSEFPTNERPLDFSITKNVVAMLLVSVLMFIMFVSLANAYKKKALPSGFGRALEPLVIYVRDDIAIPNIGKDKYKKYMGFLLTVFFFILILNLLGMTPLGINVTGNIAVTFALALITFIIVQFSGNKHYWKHIFWMPGVPVIMKIVLMPIEILGMLTKPFALMIRLFANMTAGHVVIMSLLGLIVIYQNWIAGPAFFGFTLFISVIELLVAFLQAYIFTLLSALYIGMAVEEHADHPNDHSEDIPVV